MSKIVHAGWDLYFSENVLFSVFSCVWEPPTIECLLAGNPLTLSCVQVQMSKPVRNNGGPRQDNRGGGDRRGRSWSRERGR